MQTSEYKDEPTYTVHVCMCESCKNTNLKAQGNGIKTPLKNAAVTSYVHA
jgi:hypothetical protein